MKLFIVINKRKRNEKKITWRLNNMPRENKWVNKEIKKEIKKYLVPNDNENTTIQHLDNVAKAVLRQKFIMI